MEGLVTERRVLMLKNGGLGECESLVVVRMVVGTVEVAGRLKRLGERRCGEVKRVTCRLTYGIAGGGVMDGGRVRLANWRGVERMMVS